MSQPPDPADHLPPLDEDDLVRFARQIVLPGVGGRGQRRLRQAAVAVVGAGGIGSPALLYLAGAGIGRLTIVDDDRVALDNLHRQVLFTAADTGRPKAEAAAERLRLVDRRLDVRAVVERLEPGNALSLLADHDVVVDGSDNFATKFAVNDACVRLATTAVIGAVVRLEGQVLVVPPGQPCYRCLFREEPDPGMVPSCSAAGILGPVAGTIGCLVATEVLCSLLGIGDPRGGTILVLDAGRPSLRRVPFPRDPACPACLAGAVASPGGT